MNQRVPVSFVVILAVAFAALLFFYFKATVDRYTIRVQNEIQSELIQVYDQILINPDRVPASLEVFKTRYGHLEPVADKLNNIEKFYEEKGQLREE